MRSFTRFVAIDWSGAVGARQAGIAVAICGAGDAAPTLVRPGHRWSRTEVLAWLLDELPHDTLVGLDLGVSLPFVDQGAFFPDWSDSPPDARSLWAMIDDVCTSDANLAATSFVDHVEAARHFRRHGGREGDRFGGGRGRLRVTEHAQADYGLRPTSNLNLVGASQVGKSSLTGMRLLHRLAGRLPIWPFDPVPTTGSVLVEIYTTIAAVDAKRSPGASKMRDYGALDDALEQLGSRRSGRTGKVDDHSSDALLTSAWLRLKATDDALWHPSRLDEVRLTEGWTFGVR